MSTFTSLKDRKLGISSKNPMNAMDICEDEKVATDVIVTYYKENYYKEDTVNSLENLKIDFNFDGNIWINVEGITDIDLINKIGALFEIDALSLEDILNPEQRVKIDNRVDYIKIILKMLFFEPLTKEINYQQVSFILKKNILITFQETSFDIFSSIRNRIENYNKDFEINDVNYLTYMLIDEVVDNCLLILDEVEDDIDEMETNIIDNPEKDVLEHILSLKKNIIILKRFISPLRELISKLQARSMLKYFPEDMKFYLGDLYDHSIIAFDTIDTLNNRVTELIQLYHSTISNTMNEVMKILAIISTIFMPLSFISGLYGMNFINMPEIRWKYGYFFALFLMGSMVACMLVYFKKKKWF